MPGRSKQDVKALLKALSIDCEIDDEVFELVSSSSPTIKAFVDGEISFQEALFIEFYLSNGFSPSRAARSANYAGLSAGAYGTVGGAILKKDAVKRIIGRRIAAQALTADEVLADWAEIAKADMTDFMSLHQIEDATTGEVVNVLRPDLAKAAQLGRLHLLKKFKLSADGTLAFELRDQDKALDQIARHLGMFEKDNMLQIPRGLIELLNQTPDERRAALQEYEELLESED